MRLFSSIAETYELVNHALTFGLDIHWRQVAVKEAVAGGGTHWLDICTGTGEMAAALATHAGSGTSVTALDANPEMLSIATRKVTEDRRFNLVRGDVAHMPFRDATFDLVTISFAARTVATAREHLLTLFSEVRRIINHGGQFVIVDTSQPPSDLLRRLFHLFIRVWVVPVGRILTGSGGGYTYLAHTIRHFPDAAELASILEEAGFSDIRFRRLCMGVVAVHVGYATDQDSTLGT